MPSTSIQKKAANKANKSKTDQLVNAAARALSGKKGENIVLMDIRKVTTLADYFILCTGLSENHIKTLAEEVMDVCQSELGEKPWRKEGLDTRRWIVLDFVDVVVHIFREETRNFYGIERMWSDADITEFKDS
jgi:ribosome-associated protein